MPLHLQVQNSHSAHLHLETQNRFSDNAKDQECHRAGLKGPVTEKFNVKKTKLKKQSVKLIKSQ